MDYVTRVQAGSARGNWGRVFTPYCLLLPCGTSAVIGQVASHLKDKKGVQSYKEKFDSNRFDIGNVAHACFLCTRPNWTVRTTYRSPNNTGTDNSNTGGTSPS